MMVPESIAVAIFFSVGLLAIPANAQEIIKTCVGVEVRSIGVSYERALNTPLDAKPATIETGPPGAATKEITIVIRGPVLGAMDSPQVKTELSCTTTGFDLVATISRSEHYNGTVARNRLWRPQVSMVVILDASEIIFHAIWKMRSTSGREMDLARTSPYPEEKYPITVTKTLRSVAGQKP
jgi:hypothetical protein